MPVESPESMPMTYDEEYTMVLQGFDVAVVPSDQGPDFYYVTLYEAGSEVFGEDIPVPEPQPGETSEEVIENVAQAAIDIFESERGTLGEGAGAEMTAKKKACFTLEYGHEDWYMSLKGTEYEDVAYDLLKNYYSTDLEQTAQDDVLYELYDRKKEIEFELRMLDLERMRALPAGSQIIIIKASKKAYISEAEDMQAFLDKFCGDPLEGKVVNLMNDLIDVKQDIKKHEEGQDDFYNRLNELETQMEALSLEALQANVIDKIPTSGIEAFPNMAGELAELMEGVELDAPLEPMMAKKRSQMEVSFDEIEEGDIVEYRDPYYGDLVKGKVVMKSVSTTGNPFVAIDNFSNRVSLSDVISIVNKVEAKKRSQMTPPEEPDDTYAKEWEPVEDRVKEKGEVHEGLDPAETLTDIPFQKGDKVSLKKKFETTAPINGVKVEFASGSKGYIYSEYDRHGDCFMVAFDDGGCVKVPVDFLKA